jgi:hypothetical protein
MWITAHLEQLIRALILAYFQIKCKYESTLQYTFEESKRVQKTQSEFRLEHEEQSFPFSAENGHSLLFLVFQRISAPALLAGLLKDTVVSHRYQFPL